MMLFLQSFAHDLLVEVVLWMVMKWGRYVTVEGAYMLSCSLVLSALTFGNSFWMWMQMR